MAPLSAGDIIGLDRFQALWRRCLVDAATDNSATIHRRLLNGYRETQRRYHSLAHIRHCLSMFDLCKSLLGDADAVELALWFHDVVFEPGHSDNEARSAALYEELSAGEHSPVLRTKVNRLIMATLHDDSEIDDHDTRYMVDIDLSSFGLSWDEFLLDSQHLRQENPHLSDAEYYSRQGNFQACLIARPRFFLSDFFFERFEAAARENLARYFEYVGKLA